ncbi:hypothetical protein [Motilibacter deserti]|uniref:O-antigen ligase-like membrane protein n=1 Tax=Motilibacter deserti TaxID=2714956 RepID=A0ABX0GV61_9ACTN|nr:hypothetical protein [Motilibacter deserti]NHC14393.1 hypothetical protein [Motilibacter deserti]
MGVPLVLQLAGLGVAGWPRGLLVLPAVGLLLAVAYAGSRLSHVLVAGLVAFFCIQPTLKFYVSWYFGPAKDAAVLVAVLALAIRLLRDRTALRRADPWVAGGALLLVGLYVVDPVGDHGAAWLTATRLTASAFGLFLVGWLLPDPARTWRFAAGALVAVGVAQGLLGLVQQAIGAQRLVDDFGLWLGFQVRETHGGQLRSFGTFSDPFSYAAVMAVALVAALTLPLRRSHGAVATGVIALGVIVSFVRTEAVLVVAVLVAAVAVRGHRASAVLLGAAATAASTLYLVLPARTSSTATGLDVLLTLNGRTELWSQVLRGPWDVLAGRGVGQVGTGLARSQSGLWGPTVDQAGATVSPGAPSSLLYVDNAYLSLVADVGLPGLVLTCAVFALMARTLLRAAPAAPALCGLGTLAVVAVDGLTRSSLTQFPFGYVALLVLGTALAAATHGGDARLSDAGCQPRGALSKPASSGTAAGASS